MFDDAIRKLKGRHHTLAILVYDEPGVLARVSSLFMKRNFNINTLTVGPSSQQGVSRITISFFGDEKIFEQLVKQLYKLIDVIKVSNLPDKISIIRELALIKIHTKNLQAQNQIKMYCHSYKARIVNIAKDDVVVELIGKPDKVDSFLELVKPMGIREISRTGITAMSRSNINFEKV